MWFREKNVEVYIYKYIFVDVMTLMICSPQFSRTFLLTLPFFLYLLTSFPFPLCLTLFLTLPLPLSCQLHLCQTHHITFSLLSSLFFSPFPLSYILFLPLQLFHFARPPPPSSCPLPPSTLSPSLYLSLRPAPSLYLWRCVCPGSGFCGY